MTFQQLPESESGRKRRSGSRRLKKKWIFVIVIIIIEIFLLSTYIIFTISNNINCSPSPPLSPPPSTDAVRDKPKPKKGLITQGQFGVDLDEEISRRRDFVKQMAQDAWDDYVRHAWGKNELGPVSRTGKSSREFGYRDMGVTIIDSLDTLYIMGMMKEFEMAKEFVANLTFGNINAQVSVFEVNIRIVGGLLSAYALTKDHIFLEKAKEMAELLLPAFNTPTGIPHGRINLMTGVTDHGKEANLAELGSLHLEFMYLSEVTRNATFRDKVLRVRNVIKNIPKPRNLTMTFVDINTGKFLRDTATLGAPADSYYEYLLKSSIQFQDWEARQLYDAAMDAFVNNSLIKYSQPSGMLYIGEWANGAVNNKVGHLTCFAGGLFALGAYVEPSHRNAKRDAEIGRNFTNTCHESYNRTKTGLGPETFRFTAQAEAVAAFSHEKDYVLRPEVIESYFILYRVTGDYKYRHWGWDAAQALERYTKVGPERGYAGIRNVDSNFPQKDDTQQSFFLAETLKYLYLLFSADDLISLDQWVFNTEGHPLPIKGANPNF